MGFSGNNEGPTTIPEHTTVVKARTSCFQCRYFQEQREGNVCGGFGGRLGPRVTRCAHPDAMHYFGGSGREEAEDQMVLPTSDRGTPRIITRSSLGYGDATPSWCPYLKEKK